MVRSCAQLEILAEREEANGARGRGHGEVRGRRSGMRAADLGKSRRSGSHRS